MLRSTIIGTVEREEHEDFVEDNLGDIVILLGVSEFVVERSTLSTGGVLSRAREGVRGTVGLGLAANASCSLGDVRVMRAEPGTFVMRVRLLYVVAVYVAGHKRLPTERVVLSPPSGPASVHVTVSYGLLPD